ncbi:MAG: CoA pyrophosphatase [Rhodocyclales bacterium]|nr:CoA pyrophosphatase [Rhodocyclales bacterium]
MPESLDSAGPNSSGGLLSLIRRRFSEGLVASPVIESWIAAEKELIAAAVLVPVVVRETGLTMLLTQRTAHLRDHAGQVSFPGGRCEAGDASPEATALREAEEEVGLAASQVEILGRLPQYRTGTGFVITPVVGLVTPPLNLKLDDFEVAEVFEPPLEFLLDSANHQRQSIEVRGARHEYWAMPWQGYFIWGATAGMLVTLHRMLYSGT